MRIVDFATFMSMPYGTVFAEYQPCVITGQISIKNENCGDHDFWAQSFCPSFDGQDDCTTALIEMEETGASFNADYASERDGSYDDKRLFMIWEAEDLVGLFENIRVAIERGTQAAILAKKPQAIFDYFWVRMTDAGAPDSFRGAMIVVSKNEEYALETARHLAMHMGWPDMKAVKLPGEVSSRVNPDDLYRVLCLEDAVKLMIDLKIVDLIKGEKP